MELRALLLLSALGLALLSGACAQSTRSTYTTAWVNVTQPVTVLTGIPFDLTLDLPALLPFASANGEPQPWPDRLGVVVRDPGDPTGALLLNTTLATTRLELIAANFSVPRAVLTHSVGPVVIGTHGLKNLTLSLYRVPPANTSAAALHAVAGLPLLTVDGLIQHVAPAWVSLMPPVLTIIIAVWLRQVLIALFAGVFLGAFFVDAYNPGTALLRSLDTYWSVALGGGSHAAVVLFTLFLGGLIGVVQRSGGANGLANSVTRFTSTRVSALLMVFVLGLCIFFDDYSSILIVGSTLRAIVRRLDISPERFAFQIHAMGACLASFSPVSSWTGVEVGYLAEAYSSVGDTTTNPFVSFMASIPYRFFPVMMILFIVVNVVTRREFGPMLRYEVAASSSSAASAEAFLPGKQRRKAAVAGDGVGGGVNSALGDQIRAVDLYRQTGGGADGNTMGGVLGTLDDDEDAPLLNSAMSETSGVDSVIFGSPPMYLGLPRSPSGSSSADDGADGGLPTSPLDPKPDKPMRCINAALPFGVVIFGTFFGMYFDGVDTIKDLFLAPGETRPSLSMVNVFSNSNAVSALLWSSFGGFLVAFVLSTAQRILTVQEVLGAWMVGMQEIVEPIMILTLAWSLGAVITDIHTAEFIVSAIGDSLPAGVLPMLVSIVAFVMSFATGTAFGTMGILFPLVAPLAFAVAQKPSTTSDTVLLQSMASILGGAVFGNVCSPIADNTVLAALAAKCDINTHVRSQSLYVGIVGGVSLVVGSFPVGMGWYPAWVALLLSVAVFAAMFLLLGTRTDTLGDNGKAGRAGGSQWGASHRTDGLSLNNP